MNPLKRILREKLNVTPSKDFDKKFWQRFEHEFDKEERSLTSWSIWGSGLAIAALMIFMIVVPQFSSNFHSKENLAVSSVEAANLAVAITEDLIESNSYITEDLDIDELLDEEAQIADNFE